MADKQAPEWLKLQRKIFSRWVSQKLWMSKHIKINDIVTDLQTDPTILIKLVEVLTEKPFTGKTDKVTKMRVQLIAVANQVLNFIYSSGVQMKIKTSAEDLIDGDEKNVLALIFNILLKFMKIGDEEGGAQLSAKDALLMWVQNKTTGYKDCDVKNFGTSFHSGLPLCALINKFRPQLVKYEGLDKANKAANIKTAMDAAEKYFGLEQYITPNDFLKLDENGMMVYVSEYFYGIAEQRKIDQAARRILKVVKFTKTCDAMRAEFKDQSTKFKERLTKVEKILEDRSVDNTMAGAKKKLEEFYSYKTEDKNAILGYQLNLESLFNNLAMLLAHNKRPEFVPPKGLTLKDIEAAVAHLEQVEQERKAALHAELNRQIKLVKLDEHHTSLHAKLSTYADEKQAFLEQREQLDSVGAVLFAIKTLEAFDSESADILATTLHGELEKLGSELAQEKYERTSEVKQRESEIFARWDQLAELSVERKKYLDACLAREQKKEELRIAFAHESSNYVRYVKDTSSNLELSLFGFTLEEVEAYANELAQSEENINQIATSKKGAYEQVWGEMQAMNFSDNPYTELTVEKLSEFEAQLGEAIQARHAKYDEELARQRANDALCKEFAGLADPLAQWIVKTKDAITRSKGKLREQLAFVEQKIAGAPKDGAVKSKIAQLQGKMDEAGITNNRHTLLTLKDVEVLWEQYTQFLEKKKKMLQIEIENDEMRGITAEQMAEIETNFRQFDKDNSNTIDAKELKACLYSLGEEVTQSVIAKILEEYGKNKIIDFDGFKKYMIHLFGDTDSKEDVLSGWELISKGEPIVKDDRMEFTLAQEVIEYIHQTAPKKGAGYDYKAWTEDVFSR